MEKGIFTAPEIGLHWMGVVEKAGKVQYIRPGKRIKNQYSGKFRAVGDSISISDVVSTRKACPELKIEEAFFQAIPEVIRFRVSKDNLKLYDKDKREVMNCIYLNEKDMKE
jgi:hypothetical protein